MGDGNLITFQTRAAARLAAGIFWGLLCLAFLSGCPVQRGKEAEKPHAFVLVSKDEMPDFRDDLDIQSLREAAERSLGYFDRAPKGTTHPIGKEQVSVEELRESIILLLKLAQSQQLNRDVIARCFDVYRASGDPSTGKILVTGYYEPILEGRLASDEEFCYPLYGLPADLLTIDLKGFDAKRFPDERLSGRLEGNRVVPYYTRAEIDGQGKLKSGGTELVWLKDPLAAFFLHVQGSGLIQLPGGRSQRVGYAGTNGRPYRSVGKYLQEKGAISPEEMSLQAIRAYLESHPEMMREVLWTNESYVFFRWVKDGPVGSIGVPLVGGRSIATDPAHFPKGCVAFLQTEQPRFAGTGKPEGWEPLTRWVLNQDAGGAIRGPGRVDLFWGSGESAEQAAGYMRQAGTLYLLVRKAGQNIDIR